MLSRSHEEGYIHWHKNLPAIVSTYNTNFHSGIHAKPRDVFLKKVVPVRIYTIYAMKYSVGDLVRVAVRKGTFKKGYTQTWTREVYPITRVGSRSYTVNGVKYKEHEVMKVPEGNVPVKVRPEAERKGEEFVAENKFNRAMRKEEIEPAVGLHQHETRGTFTETGRPIRTRLQSAASHPLRK